jgi:hypothetical protein
MAVNYNGPTQTARMNATLAAIDAGAAPATLEIGTAAMGSVLVVIPLSDPSFSVGGTPATLTMLGVPKSGVAGAAGTAAAARIRDGNGTAVINGLTVGVSGADINLNSTVISTGQTVTVSTGTITHSP